MVSLDGLSKLAYQHGPFFFAVLFNVFLPPNIHKMYRQAKDARQKTLYRQYFISTVAVGIILVLAASGWWVYSANQSLGSTYVYQGDLYLANPEGVTSDRLYFRQELIPSPNVDGLPSKVQHFIVVQHKPFGSSDHFLLRFGKGPGTTEEKFDLPFTSVPNAAFEFEWSESSGKTVLKDRTHSTAFALPLISSAVAAEDGGGGVRIESPVKGDVNVIPGDQVVSILQQPTSLVGLKIDALRKVLTLNAEALADIFYHPTAEPMSVTLLDLSRHSDAQLASMAKTVLFKRFNLFSYVAELSQSHENILSAVEIVRHMDKPDVDTLLKGYLDPAFRVELQKAMPSEGDFMRLVPTGTSQGDRYYVRIAYDPKQADIASEVAAFFSDSLTAHRSVEQEVEITRSRSSRAIYGYSKQFAVDTFNQFRNKAKVAFVDGSKL